MFDDHSVIDVELVGPIGSLIADKKDPTEQSFLFRANGVEHDIDVRLRGNSRLRIAAIGPVAETDVLEEFAAYRIFNLLSDIGYRVR